MLLIGRQYRLVRRSVRVVLCFLSAFFVTRAHGRPVLLIWYQILCGRRAVVRNARGLGSSGKTYAIV